jgi:uncharacterized membrane protein YfcA
LTVGPAELAVGRVAERPRTSTMADWMVLPVLAVLFLATLVRSAFGFGEALVAVPLLALLIPVTVAAPLAVLLSVTVAAVVLAQDWRHVHLGGAWRLVLATLPGIPLGLWLLTAAPEPPSRRSWPWSSSPSRHIASSAGSRSS